MSLDLSLSYHVSSATGSHDFTSSRQIKSNSGTTETCNDTAVEPSCIMACSSLFLGLWPFHRAESLLNFMWYGWPLGQHGIIFSTKGSAFKSHTNCIAILIRFVILKYISQASETNIKNKTVTTWTTSSKSNSYVPMSYPDFRHTETLLGWFLFIASSLVPHTGCLAQLALQPYGLKHWQHLQVDVHCPTAFAWQNNNQKHEYLKVIKIDKGKRKSYTFEPDHSRGRH